MRDATTRGRRPLRGAQVIEFTPLRTWPADCGVLMSSSVTYQAGQDNGVADVLCGVCLDSLGASPFSVHAMIYPGPCAQENSHMPASSIAIHAACEIPGDRDLCDLIIGLTAICQPG
jgi:hypothetical protein